MNLNAFKLTMKTKFMAHMGGFHCTFTDDSCCFHVQFFPHILPSLQTNVEKQYGDVSSKQCGALLTTWLSSLVDLINWLIENLIEKLASFPSFS